jgi:hypothetical protein
VWTVPADLASIISLPLLQFTTPSSMAQAMFFEMLIDTAATFDSGSLRDIRSDLDQTGWDFWNGSGWAAVGPGGVDPAYAGNEIRYTVQTPLAGGTWYRKVRVGV